MKKLLALFLVASVSTCLGQSIKPNAWTTNTQAAADIYGGTKFAESLNGQATNLTGFVATSNTPALMIARTGKIMIAATNVSANVALDTGYIVIGSGQNTNSTGGNIVFPDRGGIFGPQGAGVYFWADHGNGRPLVIMGGGDVDLIPDEGASLQIGSSGGSESSRHFLQYKTIELDNANPLGWSAILEGRAVSWTGAGYASATHTPGLSFRAANTNDASKHGQFTLWAQSPEWAVGNHTAVPTTAGLDLLTGHPVNGLTMGSTLDLAYGVGWNGSLRIPTMNAIYDKIESLAPGGDGISFPLVQDTMIATNMDFPLVTASLIIRTNYLDDQQVGLEFNGVDGRQTSLGFGYNELNGAFIFGGNNSRFLFSTPAEIWGMQYIYAAGGVDTATVAIDVPSRQLRNASGAIADFSGTDFSAVTGTRLATDDFISGGVTLAAIDNDGKLQRQPLFNITSNTGNSGTAETDLLLFDVNGTSAFFLAENESKLCGTFTINLVASATASRRIKIYATFGIGTPIVLYDSGAITFNTSGALVFNTFLTRISTSAIRCTTSLATPTASTFPYTSYVANTTDVDFTEAMNFTITGEADGAGAASDDIVLVHGFIEGK